MTKLKVLKKYEIMISMGAGDTFNLAPFKAIYFNMFCPRLHVNILTTGERSRLGRKMI